MAVSKGQSHNMAREIPICKVWTKVINNQSTIDYKICCGIAQMDSPPALCPSFAIHRFIFVQWDPQC